MLTDICWKKTSEENYLLQCICKFNNILCTVPALKKLFQYALKKKKNENKIPVQSSIFYNTDKFRNQNFSLPATLAAGIEQVKSYCPT